MLALKEFFSTAQVIGGRGAFTNEKETIMTQPTNRDIRKSKGGIAIEYWADSAAIDAQTRSES